MSVHRSATVLCDDCEASSVIADTAAEARGHAKNEGWLVGKVDRCPRCIDMRAEQAPVPPVHEDEER